MADSGTLVTVSGAALSLLFYDNAASFGDQLGFLLGDVLMFVTKKVTDSDRQIEDTKIHINVNSTVVYSDELTNSAGKINKAKLREFLGDVDKKVIGWFRFRRNGTLSPTLRDKVLHKQLTSFFSEYGSIKKDLFLMCMLNSSIINRGATHKFRHVFLKYCGRNFQPVPLEIKNLGNNAVAQHDGSEYKPKPASRLTDHPDLFTELLRNIRIDVKKGLEKNCITTIQRKSEQLLNDYIPKTFAYETEIARLELQVRDLRTRLIARDLKLAVDQSRLRKDLEQKQKLEKHDEENMKMIPKSDDLLENEFSRTDRYCSNFSPASGSKSAPFGLASAILRVDNRNNEVVSREFAGASSCPKIDNVRSQLNSPYLEKPSNVSPMNVLSKRHPMDTTSKINKNLEANIRSSGTGSVTKNTNQQKVLNTSARSQGDELDSLVNNVKKEMLEPREERTTSFEKRSPRMSNRYTAKQENEDEVAHHSQTRGTKSYSDAMKTCRNTLDSPDH